MLDVSEQLRIGDVARRTGLTVPTLRYYEEIGLLPPSDRLAGGHRVDGLRPRPTRAPTTPSVHRAGSPEAVAAVVAAGADVDAYEGGRSALHHHAWIGDVEMVRALLAAGADPNLLDDEHGTTALAWAEYGRQPETESVLRSETRSTP